MAEDLRDKYLVKFDEQKISMIQGSELLGEFGFKTTAEIKSSEGLRQVIGQEKALRKQMDVLRTEKPTFNVLTVGTRGTGKSFASDVILNEINEKIVQGQEYIAKEKEKLQKQRKNPIEPLLEEFPLLVAEVNVNTKLEDQLTMYNFKKSTKPLAIILPRGYGKELRDDLVDFVRSVKGTSKSNPYSDFDEGKVKEIVKKYNDKVKKLNFDNIEFSIDLASDGHGMGLKTSYQAKIPPKDKEELDVRLAKYEDLKDKMYQEIYSLADKKGQKPNQKQQRGKTIEDDIESDGNTIKINADDNEYMDRPLFPEFEKENFIQKIFEDFGFKIIGTELPSYKKKYSVKSSDVQDKIIEIVDKYDRAVKKLNFKDYKFGIELDVNEGIIEYTQPPQISAETNNKAKLRSPQLNGIAKECEQEIKKALNPMSIESDQSNDKISQAKATFAKLKDKWSAKKHADYKHLDQYIEKLTDWFDQASKDIETMDFSGKEMYLNKAGFDKYNAELLVDNSKIKGVPIVKVENPSVQNLFGDAGHDALNSSAEHTRLKSGALMEANGGFVYIDEGIVALSHEDLRNYLLTVMQTEELRIGGGRGLAGGGTSANIESEPFHAKVKYIMNANENVLAILQTYPQIARRFILVDFKDTMENTKETRQDIARYVGDVITRYNNKAKKKMPHFSKDAVSYIVDHANMVTGEKDKLTNVLSDIEKMVLSIAKVASDNNVDVVTNDHIKYFFESDREVHSEREQKFLQDLLKENEIVLSGDKVGKVNGLVYIQNHSGYPFGGPARIEATIVKGKGELSLIEQLSSMAGKTMVKGFNIGKTYLMNRYGMEVSDVDKLDGRISFPISLSEMDGNSASAAGVFAVLSKLSDIPINQGIVVTGAVIGNEGEVGKVGGTYEKVLGAYKLSKLQNNGTLDGSQGAMIPEDNLTDFLLKIKTESVMKDDILNGKFKLYTFNNLDEGWEVLTNTKALDMHAKNLEKMKMLLV